MPTTTLSRAELLDDSAVYRRTHLGQRHLLQAAEQASTAAMRILARVNGYTNLRRLIDLAPDEAGTIGAAVAQLYERGLIEPIDPA